MNQQLIAKDDASDSMIVRPQQSLSTAESSRVMGEIQAAMMIARSTPRDERYAQTRIMTACQRQRLAEDAEFSYSKGGNKIAGATIRLLETVACNWGNINFGFRELSNSGGESTVEAFAWDLETNTKAVKVFTVPHRMKSGDSFKTLTDPRDIYEHVANYSQRRVRACLENVIPRDIIEDALDECRKTLKAKVDITPASIKTMVDAFQKDHGVSKAQIEERLGRIIESIEPAQFLGMRRIYNSLRDGMSEVKDWFKPEKVESTADQAKPKTTADKLKKPAAAKTEPKTEAPKSEAQSDAKPEATDPKLIESYKAQINKSTTMTALSKVAAAIESDAGLDAESKKTLTAEVESFLEVLNSDSAQ